MKLLGLGEQAKVSVASNLLDFLEFDIGQGDPLKPFYLKRINIWNENRAFGAVDVFSFSDDGSPILIGRLTPYAENVAEGHYQKACDIPFTGKLKIFFYGTVAGDVLKANGAVLVP